MKRAVYFFCPRPELDTVATHVLDHLRRRLSPQPSGLVVDGMPALFYVDAAGNRFDFVSCAYYFSHRYETYLDMANVHFKDCDIAGYVNWHGGANAPDKVLTVHSIGDVMTGKFAPSNPLYLRNLAVALERGRAAAGLDDFTTHTEATHWSGAIHGSDTALIEQLQVPIVDIEIGSAPETLADLRAAAVLADALLAVFDDDRRPKTLLCLGGIHFDSTYSAALIQPALPLSIGHFLPTIWLVNGDYSGERGLALLQHALDTVIGGVDAIVFNDNMKKPVKDCVRAFAEQSGLPLLKHRRLHAPLEIDWTG
ncbi:MAG: hypothetical protein GXX99_03575 [Clostridiales bacterium]|nr:hypothetical protein [Clostridiales bacterium]